MPNHSETKHYSPFLTQKGRTSPPDPGVDYKTRRQAPRRPCGSSKPKYKNKLAGSSSTNTDSCFVELTRPKNRKTTILQKSRGKSWHFHFPRSWTKFQKCSKPKKWELEFLTFKRLQCCTRMERILQSIKSLPCRVESQHHKPTHPPKSQSPQKTSNTKKENRTTSLAQQKKHLPPCFLCFFLPSLSPPPAPRPVPLPDSWSSSPNPPGRHPPSPQSFGPSATDGSRRPGSEDLRGSLRKEAFKKKLGGRVPKGENQPGMKN